MSLDLKKLPSTDLKSTGLNDLFRGVDPSRKGKTRSLPLTRSALLNTPGLSVLSGTPSQDGIFRIANVNYYLELRSANQDEPLLVIGFPFDPSFIQIDTSQSIQLTHTLNTTFREATQNNMRTITIQGQSGYAPRLGFARDGGYCFENGEIIMEEFEEFLNNYNYLLYKHSNSLFKNFTGKDTVYATGSQGNVIHSGYKDVIAGKDKYFLTLRCVKENIRYKVEPIQFVINKDATRNKFGYHYTLNLTAYGIYGQGKRENFLKNILDNASAYIRLAALAAAFAESIVLNINEDYINPIRGPIIAVNQSLGQIENLFGTTGAVANNAINIIFEAVETLKTIPDRLANIGNVAVSQFDATKAGFNSAFAIESSSSSLSENSRNSFKNNQLPDNDARLKDYLGEGNTTILFEKQTFPLRFKENATLKEKKDLDKVLEMLTDFETIERSEDRVNDIAALIASLNSIQYNLQNLLSLIPLDFEPNQIDNNNLGKFERINFRNLNDNDEGSFTTYILKEGENLHSVARKVLGSDTAVSQLISVNGWLDSQRRGDGTLCDAGDIIKIPSDNINLIFGNNGLGVDLSCPQTTLNYEYDVDGNPIDIKLVKNDNNIEQAIKNALLTYPGELRSAINFGLANIVGIKNLEYVKTIVNDRLLKDERLNSITFNDIYLKEDKVIINMSISTINRQNLNITTSLNI